MSVLLITMHEWLGPGEKIPKEEARAMVPRTGVVTFSSRLSINDALGRLAKYQTAYNDHYRLAVNFSILSIAETPDISDVNLEFFGVRRVEFLAQNPADF